MQAVTITHKIDEPFYCPFCGCLTLTGKLASDSEKNECSHLPYIGITEGGLEYENDRIKKLFKPFKESMDEDGLISIKLDDAIHFSLCSPAPSMFGVFVGYQKQ